MIKYINDLLKENNKATKIIDDEKEWSLGEIKEKAECLKNILVNKGVKKGERVAVICDNSVYFVISFFGILFSGGIPVILNTKLADQQVNNICEEYNIVYLCTYFSNKQKCTYTANILYVDALVSSVNASETLVKIDLEDDDVAMILFSSGTTGKPQGVMLSHKAILANIRAILEYSHIDDSDVLYVAKSLAHSSSIVGELLLSLYCGSTIILKSLIVSPNILFKRLNKYCVTVLVINPTLLGLITFTHVKCKCDSLRVIYTCGAPVSNTLIEYSMKKFTGVFIFNMYGATEAGPRITAQRYDRHNTIGSAGYPVKGTNVIIVDDKFHKCEIYVVGNILVKSQSLMSGYYNNEEKMKEKFWNGWLITGDIGYFNERGELFVSGRKDDIIIRSAHNIDPNYVENAILKLPVIKECVVFGVKKKGGDEKEVCLFIAEQFIEKKAIFAHCKNVLASYEIPQEFIQVSNIPKNCNGKISRKMLCEEFKEIKLCNEIKE